jgi:hypothetical protein
MKKKISEITNRTKPKLNPFCTAKVWCPWKVPSLEISLNHKVIVETREINPRVNKNKPLEYPWNVITPDRVTTNKENDTAIGQGEASTK